MLKDKKKWAKLAKQEQLIDRIEKRLGKKMDLPVSTSRSPERLLAKRLELEEHYNKVSVLKKHKNK